MGSNFGFFLVQPIATHPCCFGGHFTVFNFCSCSCCSRRRPKTRCVFANATFTGGHATARSHENRSRGVVLSCRVRWHMRGGMRVPYHARAPQQREQRSRFGHCSHSIVFQTTYMPIVHFQRRTVDVALPGFLTAPRPDRFFEPTADSTTRRAAPARLDRSPSSPRVSQTRIYLYSFYEVDRYEWRRKRSKTPRHMHHN